MIIRFETVYDQYFANFSVCNRPLQPHIATYSRIGSTRLRGFALNARGSVDTNTHSFTRKDAGEREERSMG